MHFTNKNEINRHVNDEEILVRGYFYYIHCDSKNVLKPQLFLPNFKNAHNDVSVLRLQYTNPNFCKKHSQEINMGSDMKYMGFALIQARFIKETSLKLLDTLANINIIGSPIDDAGNYISDDKIVLVTDKGLPMHADISYEINSKPNEPIPQEIKKFAKCLAKNARVFPDPDTTSENWTGEPLKVDVDWQQLIDNVPKV